MPSFLSSAALAVAFMAAAAQALPSVLDDPTTPEYDNGLPKVTPVHAGTDCTGFGAGNFSLIISHCTNSTTDEPCNIDGFRNNVQLLAEPGNDDPNEGYISFPVSDDEPPINKIHCFVASRSVEVLEIYTPSHGSDLSSSRVGITNLTDSETLLWSDTLYPVPEPYEHYTHDGDRFEGAFLGFNKETGWAVKYHEASSGSEDSYWGVRLLANGEELREGESATWIKIEGSF